jgi:uncharacterized integral membrane protein (TIGR00697 family)
MHLNEELFVFFLLLDMALVVAIYRLFGKEGLFGYVVLAIITCNIEVVKLVDMFGLQVTLGNILYGSIFLTSDILAEVYGKREAKKAVWLGFCAMILFTLFTQISLHFIPDSFDQSQPHLAAILSALPRITIGSLLAYIVSQNFDVWLFLRIKHRMQGRALWLRNNVSVLASQLVDTLLFTLVALAPLPLLGQVPGFENWSVVGQVALTTYIFKLVISVSDTPFVYLARLVGNRYYPPTPEPAALAAEPRAEGSMG